MAEAVEAMMTPDEQKAAVLDSLERTEKGGVLNTIANCVTVLERDPLLTGALAYNVMTERTDIIKNLGWFKETPALTDTDVAYLQLYLETNYSLTTEKKIEKAIDIVADKNRYHPVRDYLNALQWDGQERIRHGLHHFLGAEESDYTYEVMKLFMMGAIHRVFHPGCKFEVILCLVGGQGAGKSTFFRFLALKDEWFTDDLKNLGDDNVYRFVQFAGLPALRPDREPPLSSGHGLSGKGRCTHSGQ